MGFSTEIIGRRASLAALDDLYDAVDDYIEHSSTTNWSRVVIARDKAKASKERASTRVDL